ncbi:MAG: hypothetical protein ACJ72Z_10865 [Pyrinomonadaceae bacterium]
MSFTLQDMSSENFEFTANVWNWKAALEVIKGLDVVSEGKLRQMGYNATGVKIEIEEAHLLGEKVRDEVLPKLKPDQRIFADGTITNAPDDMTLFKDDDEQWKNYSVGYDWLKDFSEFCLRSKGFQVF